ncbi:MAG: hypothetical protein EXR75_09405 [Myxococcales bacterium]|nr:hypothetical protein [Myxococcales bacterium]
MSLSALLLERALATPDALDRAAQKQLVCGGDLGALLVSDGVLDETELHDLLAEYNELPPGPRGRLPEPEVELAGRVSPTLMRRFHALPYRVTRRTLHVLVEGPLELDVEGELRDLFGRQLRLELVTPLRLAEALHRYAGVALTTFAAALLARLGPATSVASPAPEIEVPRAADETAPPSYRRMSVGPDGVRPSERPPRRAQRTTLPSGAARVVPLELARPLAQPQSHPQSHPLAMPPAFSRSSAVDRAPLLPPAPPADHDDVRTIPPAELYEPEPCAPSPSRWLGPQTMRPSDSPEPSPQSGRGEDLAASLGGLEAPRSARHKGPLVRERALAALEAADDAAEVLEVLGRHARQYFERTVVMVVAHGVARVRQTFGLSMPEGAPAAFTLDAGGVLADAVEQRSALVVQLAAHGRDHELATWLAGHEGMPVAVVPVCVGKRIVALVYADEGGGELDELAVISVAEVARTAADILAQLVLSRKNNAD